MTKLADNPQTEAAKKAVEADKKLADKSRAEFAERSKGKPTPTQEENDLAMCGAHILEHEPDGSNPDPNVTTGEPQAKPQHEAHDKSLEAQHARPQDYQTRQQRTRE